MSSAGANTGFLAPPSKINNNNNSGSSNDNKKRKRGDANVPKCALCGNKEHPGGCWPVCSECLDRHHPKAKECPRAKQRRLTNENRDTPAARLAIATSPSAAGSPASTTPALNRVLPSKTEIPQRNPRHTGRSEELDEAFEERVQLEVERRLKAIRAVIEKQVREDMRRQE